MSGAHAATPLPKKLGLVGDAVFAVVDAPPGFERTLGDVGDAVWQRHLMPPLDVVIGFFTSRVALEHRWARLAAAAQPDGAVWVCWPKQGSGTATDLDDVAVRELVLPAGWVDDKVCAVDATWSAMRFVLRRDRRAHRRR